MAERVFSLLDGATGKMALLMKRLPWPLVAAPILSLMVLCLTAPTTARADNGNARPTLSFFSGGGGAHADWFVTEDQPPLDTDRQAIRLQTTDQGYAGILFHHVTGIPAPEFPDSSFWNKTPYPYAFEPSTLGSPRLVVTFQNAAGVYVGYGDLRENTRGNGWDHVSDIDSYPNAAWDVMNVPYGHACYPFRYNVHWTDVQACFAQDFTLSVYITTDPYNIYHLIDDIEVNGKMFSSASDNSNGDNNPAGPLATLDASLLPPLPFPNVPSLVK
jgi:hypothetical protein